MPRPCVRKIAWTGFIFLFSHTVFFWSKFHTPQNIPQVADLNQFFVTAGDDLVIEYCNWILQGFVLRDVEGRGKGEEGNNPGFLRS